MGLEQSHPRNRIVRHQLPQCHLHVQRETTLIPGPVVPSLLPRIGQELRVRGEQRVQRRGAQAEACADAGEIGEGQADDGPGWQGDVGAEEDADVGGPVGEGDLGGVVVLQLGDFEAFVDSVHARRPVKLLFRQPRLGDLDQKRGIVLVHGKRKPEPLVLPHEEADLRPSSHKLKIRGPLDHLQSQRSRDCIPFRQVPLKQGGVGPPDAGGAGALGVHLDAGVGLDGRGVPDQPS
mmetsp:Transcript_34953/g.91477  ORF Transcript_34953/g.91477 Transcript_34953/m.91477 type:complete len:235 (+) Transcript_34953:1957-2661(+)